MSVRCMYVSIHACMHVWVHGNTKVHVCMCQYIYV